MFKTNTYSDYWLTNLKYFGLVSMVLDHCNRFVFEQEVSPELGRLAMPLFVFVLSFNLARIPVSVIPRIIGRLLCFGLISTPVYIIVGAPVKYSWWPLNILFTLMGIALIVYLLSYAGNKMLIRVAARVGAIVVFLVAGVVVEYFWIGLGLGASIWALFRYAKISLWGRASILFSICVWLALLNDMNGNAWALASVPIILAGWFVAPTEFKLPRCKWLFYWFYPAHLAFILLFSS